MSYGCGFTAYMGKRASYFWEGFMCVCMCGMYTGACMTHILVIGWFNGCFSFISGTLTPSYHPSEKPLVSITWACPLCFDGGDSESEGSPLRCAAQPLRWRQFWELVPQLQCWVPLPRGLVMKLSSLLPELQMKTSKA